MIRNLFNNRWFVVALAVGSGLILVRSVAAPFFDEPDFSDVEDPEYYLDAEVDDSGAGNSEMAALQPGQSVLSGQLNWNTEAHRDPFSRGHSPLVAESVVVVSVAGSSLPVLPRLDALVAGPESLLAVLDDKIVREGDSIAGFRVARIDSDGVLLSAANTSHRLRVADMRFDQLAGTSASKDPAQDSPVNEERFPGGDSGF